MVQVLSKGPANPLDLLVRDGAPRALQLLLWQQRLTNPDMSVIIKPDDIKGLDDCTEYLKIKPDVRIFRPGGMPAIPPAPAMGKRPATSGRPEIPFKDYVVVQMIEAGTENTFKPIENNQQDFDKSQALGELRRLRETIPELAAAVKAGIARGQFSESEIIELCDAAVRVARAGLTS